MQDDQDNGEFPVSDNPESNQTSYDDEADARDSRTFQVADHGIAHAIEAAARLTTICEQVIA